MEKRKRGREAIKGALQRLEIQNKLVDSKHSLGPWAGQWTDWIDTAVTIKASH